MNSIRKALIGFKDALDTGAVLAVFSRLNVVDKDGDKTLPGFIGKQTIAMLPAHDWRHVVIGKGTTRESGDEVLAEIKMNLEIPAAKDWHSAIKFDLANPPALQEWSYGFTLLPGGSVNGDGKEIGRILQPASEGNPGCIVHEVSPVLVGAGINTTTLAAKGVKFCDELEMVLGATDNLVNRAQSLAELRAKEGRGLTATSQDRLGTIRERLKAAVGVLAGIPSDDEALRLGRVELVRYLRKRHGL